MKAMKKAKVSKAVRPQARRGKPSDHVNAGPKGVQKSTAKALVRGSADGKRLRSDAPSGPALATDELAPRLRGRPKGSTKQLPSAVKASGLAGLAMPVIAQAQGRWIVGDRQASREFWSSLEYVLPGTVLELEARDTQGKDRGIIRVEVLATHPPDSTGCFVETTLLDATDA